MCGREGRQRGCTVADHPWQNGNKQNIASTPAIGVNMLDGAIVTIHVQRMVCMVVVAYVLNVNS